MQFKVALSFIALMFVISSVDAARPCPRCHRHHAPQNEQRSEEYDPYKRYYPYCSIYQDSRVQNVTNDDEEGYWPGKRDDDFIDSLTR